MSNKKVHALRADRKAAASTTRELAALDDMSVGELAEKYREVFGEPTRTRNKDYLKKRLAWRIQELAEGGLSQGALARIHQLGDQMPERWRMRQSQGQGASDAAAPTEALQVVQATEPRDPRVHQRTGAHRTRLLRDQQRRLDAPLPEVLRRGAQRDDLGVCRRVAIHLAAVAPTADDAIVEHDDRTDGYIPGCSCRVGFFQRETHPVFVSHTHFARQADPRGVEPLTPGSVDRCSIH